jgi:hypothetical protein
MSRASTLEQLADKLLRIEEEVRAIRGDLEEELRRESRPPFRRINGSLLSNWAADLSVVFSLEDPPAGALEVQEMSRGAGLGPDELSRALIQAREE